MALCVRGATVDPNLNLLAFQNYALRPLLDGLLSFPCSPIQLADSFTALA